MKENLKIRDFSDCKINLKAYNGANGNKISIIFNNEVYLLKFAPIKKNSEGKFSKSFSSICEFISSQISKSLGVFTHEVSLGIYNDEIVAVCKDFTYENGIQKYNFYDFFSIKNTTPSNKSAKDCELSEILKACDEQIFIRSEILKEHFWDMFIVDSLLGNFDRHNGNWGLLVGDNECIISPVFDYGSCLYPLLTQNDMQKILKNPKEIDERIYTFPNSAIKLNGKKINLKDFFTNNNDENFIKSFRKIYPKIDFKKINNIIEQIPVITDIQKEFYKMIIKKRKEKILDIMKFNKSK